MNNAVIGIQTVSVLRIKFVFEERFLDYARNDASGFDSSTTLEMTIYSRRMTIYMLGLTRVGQEWRKRMRSLEQRFQDDAGGLDFSTALEMTFINQNDIMNQDDTNYLDSSL